MFARLALPHAPISYVIRMNPVIPSARMRRPLRAPVSRPEPHHRVPLQARFQTRPALHAPQRRTYSSIPAKENQSLDAIKLGYLSDTFCTLTNNKIADAGTLTLLLNKITVPKPMDVMDIKSLAQAVHILGEDGYLTKEKLVDLLENTDKCSDISAALVFLHNHGLLNHYTADLVINNATDLFSRFDLIFKMLPSQMMTMHNLRMILTPAGRSLDLAFIYLQMNDHGIVNQKNLDHLYMYAQHAKFIRLMLDNLPAKCDAQTMFENILDQIVLIKSILSYATNNATSQDKVKTIVNLIFAHIDHLGALEHEVRKQVIIASIAQDLISKTRHSLFAIGEKNAKISAMITNAAIESRPAFKPKV